MIFLLFSKITYDESLYFNRSQKSTIVYDTNKCYLPAVVGHVACTCVVQAGHALVTAAATGVAAASPVSPVPNRSKKSTIVYDINKCYLPAVVGHVACTGVVQTGHPLAAAAAAGVAVVAAVSPAPPPSAAKRSKTGTEIKKNQ